MRPYSRLFTLVVMLLISLKVQATPNACGVTAGFVTIPVEATIDNIPVTEYDVKNTSVGATNVVYRINKGPYQAYNGPFRLFAGPNTITQIASNGDCRDTLLLVVFVPGKMPVGKPNVTAHIGHLDNYFQGHSITTTADDHVIISSKEFNSFTPYPNLVRMDRYGCIKKAIGGSENMMWEAVSSNGKGDNILRFSATNRRGSGIADLSDNLEVLWAKVLTSSYGPLSPFLITHLPVSGFVSISQVPVNPEFTTGFIVASHEANGNVQWAKRITFPDYDLTYTSNMAAIGNRLYMHVQNVAYIIDHFEVEEQIIAFDLLTGSIIWQKRIGMGDNMFWTNDIIAQNGKLILTGYWDDPKGDPNAFTTILQMDTDGNIERAADLLNTDFHSIARGGTYKIRDIDGQHFYLQLYGFIAQSVQTYPYISSIIKMNPDWSMDWKRFHAENSFGPVGFGTVLKDGSLAAFGSGMGGNMTPGDRSFKMHYQAFDKDFKKESVICDFTDIEMQTKFIDPLLVFDLPVLNIYNEKITATDTTMAYTPVDMTIRYSDENCMEYLDSCSMIKVTGPEEICRLQDTYTYTAWRNPACSQDVSWDLPQTASIVQKTGNTIKIRFNGVPEGFIKAYIQNACVSVRDSITIKFSDRAVGPLNLGNDTSICKNSGFDITPKQGYEMYNWSTGSNASNIRADQPGKYWLQVQDACGVTYTDTIVVAEKLKEFINAGPDQDLCVGTAVDVIAPDGYEDYRWTNERQELLSSTSRITVAAVLPGMYFLEARVPGSCMAYDTVVVTSKIAPLPVLGADTSICTGSSIQFDVGNGFQSYEWSTGETSPGIKVKQPGKYTVIVTAANGCKGEASRQLSLFDKPMLSLNKSDYLCKGETRILDAGTGYTAYRWQDGSGNSSFTVNGIGKYWVSVTDNHQCSNADTIQILRIIDPPANFLETDATICFNSDKQLGATADFSAYQWSTGEQSAYITVRKQGLYWLQVRGLEGCTGRDSITLRGIECRVGIHFPNAFSPNGDGQNDVFKPLLYNQVELYEFSVFNRFGQLVFSSKDPQKGWDGLVHGKRQDANSFNWTCSYKLVGQPLTKEKGVVLVVH